MDENNGLSRRRLPSDEAAECSVLGIVLTFGGRAIDLIPLLMPSDFYDAKHEVIYAAMRALNAKSARIDFITVHDQMERMGTARKLAGVDGIVYLSELAGLVASIEGIEVHAEIVRDKARTRALILAADRVMQAGYADDRATDELMALAQREVTAVTDTSVISEPLHIKAVINDSIQDLDRRFRDKRAVTGIPLGITGLDEMTSGWQATDLIVAAARPGLGKTSFGVDAALSAATNGHPVMFFSTEMGRRQIGNRILSSDAGVDGMRMRTGLVESRDWTRLVSSAQRLKDCPLWVDDCRQTIETLTSILRRWKRDSAAFPRGDELGLVVIDYLQLIGSLSPKANSTRDREVGLITTGLKALAKELNLPILLLSQLNRGPENRSNQRPTLGDLRESGSIEQDADVVIGLYREDYYNAKCDNPGIAEMIILKQRNGCVGTAKAFYRKECTRFENPRSAA